MQAPCEVKAVKKVNEISENHKSHSMSVDRQFTNLGELTLITNLLKSPLPNIFNEHRSALKLGLLHMLSKNVRLPSKRNKPVELPLEINSHSSSSCSTINLIGEVARIATQREKSGK